MNETFLKQVSKEKFLEYFKILSQGIEDVDMRVSLAKECCIKSISQQIVFLNEIEHGESGKITNNNFI